MGKHEDLDGDHRMTDVERKAPGGLLTLDALSADDYAAVDQHLAEHDLTEHAPGYAYPADPDDDGNPLVLTRTIVIPRGAAAPSAVGALASGGCVIPQLVADVARVVGLELAAAATLVEKESGGGHHQWGHDPVDTGGCYVKGGPVTVENYRCFRASKTAGWNGVAETQLTYKGFIYAAEKRHPNGAADPATNCHVGFETLAQGIRANGLRTGYRAYNGSGPAAEKYADDALVRIARWRQRLAGATPSPPAPAGRPNLRPGATGPLVGALQHFFNDRFEAYRGTPIPILPTPIFGPKTADCVVEFQGRCQPPIPTGGPVEIGPKTWAALDREGFRG